MLLDDYLNQFIDHESITLIGPLYAQRSTHSDPVIYVDGGAGFRITDSGVTVGDGDSAGFELDHMLDCEKDMSDLSFVLSRLNDRFRSIQLSGFLGGRKDHELFNLGECHHFLARQKESCQLFFDDTIRVFSAGTWKMNLHGLFSLAALSPSTITLAGDCQYTLNEPTVLESMSSHGLSNSGYGEVTLINDSPIFVFYPVSDIS